MTDDANNVDDKEISDEELLEVEVPLSPQLWSDEKDIPVEATPIGEAPDAEEETQPDQRTTPETAARFVRKTKARELALQMLFQADLNPETSEQDIADQLRERLPQADLFQFAWDLYRGVLRDQDSLDREIAATAVNWKVSRMAATDRNVLRLGAYELQNMDTPYGVVLDEAIDLAKKFGAGQSASFVNGVLDKLVPDSKRPEGTSRPASASPAPQEVEEPSTPPDTSSVSAYARPEDVDVNTDSAPIAFRRKKADDPSA